MHAWNLHFNQFRKSYDEATRWSNAGDSCRKLFFFSLSLSMSIIYSAKVLRGVQWCELQGCTVSGAWSAVILCWGERKTYILWLPLYGGGRVSVLFLKAVTVDFIQLEGHLSNCFFFSIDLAWWSIHLAQWRVSLPLRRYRVVKLGRWDLRAFKQRSMKENVQSTSGLSGRLSYLWEIWRGKW